MIAVGDPLALGPVTLRNRLVATAHASGLVRDGLPVAGDADYWGRLAAGGAAMLIGGGTVTAPESAPRRGNILEAWRPETVKPRAGAWTPSTRRAPWPSASSCTWAARRSARRPGSRRSRRRPSARRASRRRRGRCASMMVDRVVEGFRASAAHALEAGFDGIELHAAHGHLLEQFLSPRTNHRGDGAAVLARVIDAVRDLAPSALLGVRFSVDAAEDVALTAGELAELLPAVHAVVDWINVTVGVRTTYVRDMATTRSPVLGERARLRPLMRGPLVVSHAFRRPEAIAEALAAGADLVGMARPLIADPDLPRRRRGRMTPTPASPTQGRALTTSM